jgi:hypothetical protein
LDRQTDKKKWAMSYRSFKSGVSHDFNSFKDCLSYIKRLQSETWTLPLSTPGGPC